MGTAGARATGFLLSPPGFPPRGGVCWVILIRWPEAGVETPNCSDFQIHKLRPLDTHTPPPSTVVQDRQDPPSPSGMANGQVLLEPNLALAASCRQQRELVNLPIIAAFKGTAQQLGWRRERQERSIAAGPRLINIFHRLIAATAASA